MAGENLKRERFFIFIRLHVNAFLVDSNCKYIKTLFSSFSVSLTVNFTYFPGFRNVDFIITSYTFQYLTLSTHIKECRSTVLRHSLPISKEHWNKNHKYLLVDGLQWKLMLFCGRGIFIDIGVFQTRKITTLFQSNFLLLENFMGKCTIVSVK